MLIELLRPCGAELARRWVAALLLVPVEEREAVVGSVEARIAALYTDPADDELASGPVEGTTATAAPAAASPPAGAQAGTSESDVTMLHVASEPVQRDGYYEQEIRTYEAPRTGSEAANHGRDGVDARDGQDPPASDRVAAG